MKKEEFEKSINAIDDFRTKFDKTIGDLRVKLMERAKSLIQASAEIYDQLSAIIAREGGENVSYMDGGRNCSIEFPADGGTTDKLIVTYSNLYEDGGNKFTAIIEKTPNLDATEYEDFQSLDDHFKVAKELEGRLELADKVIKTYLSYQSRLNNDRSKLSAQIENDEDEEGYW